MLQSLLHLLYPKTCAACGMPAHSGLCTSCRAEIRVHPDVVCCKTCGKVIMEPTSSGRVAATCKQCLRHPPHYDAARSAAAFSGPVRDLIHAFKYNRSTWLRHELSELLAGSVITYFNSERIHAVCPVPLNRRKERQRGYNQAALLAEKVAKSIQTTYLPNVLARSRNTPTQTHMSAQERRRNVAGAFQSPAHLRPWVYGRCFLLIDDVMTTGSTLSECAAALKANGAERVLAATVARD